MPTSVKAFDCAECGESLPVSALGRRALALSGSPSRVEAVEILESFDLVCQRCETLDGNDLEALELWEDAGYLGRTTAEEWELSGVQLSPGEQVFRMLNY